MSKLLLEKQNTTQSFQSYFFFSSILFIRLVIRNLQPTYHMESRIQTHSVSSQPHQTAAALHKVLKGHLAAAQQGGILISTLLFPEWKELYSALQHTLSCCKHHSPCPQLPYLIPEGQGKVCKPSAREGKSLSKAASHPKTRVKKGEKRYRTFP